MTTQVSTNIESSNPWIIYDRIILPVLDDVFTKTKLECKNLNVSMGCKTIMTCLCHSLHACKKLIYRNYS